MLRKLGQEEMVGLVVIMIVVTVIGLVFLGMFARKEPAIYPSGEATGFLYSARLYTVECRPDATRENYNLGECWVACPRGESCYGTTKTACEVLNETLKKMIEKSFKIGPEAKYAGYSLEIYSANTKITSMKSARIGGNMIAGSYFDEYNDVNVSFKLYPNY
jgi:hypothetical protein